MGVTQIH